jgi:hypothetical protein
VVAHGHMQSGTFVADEVLAKHEEKYMPPEVAKSLKRRHGEAREGALSGTQPGAAADGQGQAGTAHAGEGTPPPSTTSTQAPSPGDTPALSTGSTRTPVLTGAEHPSTGGSAAARTITSEARAFSTPTPAGS